MVKTIANISRRDLSERGEIRLVAGLPAGCVGIKSPVPGVVYVINIPPAQILVER